MMTTLRTINANKNASFFVNTTSGFIGLTCIIVTVASAGLAAPVTAPLGLLSSTTSLAVTKTLKDENHTLLNKSTDLDNSDLVSLGKLGFNLVTMGLSDIFEVSSSVVDAAG